MTRPAALCSVLSLLTVGCAEPVGHGLSLDPANARGASGAASVSCADGERAVYWEDTDGDVEDVSDTWTAGTTDAVARITHTSGGTFTFCPGTYYVALKFSTSAVSLVGAEGADETILSGDLQRQLIFSSTDITISGLTLESGQDSYYGVGGNLYVFGADADIEDSVIQLGLASNGANLGMSRGTLTLTDVDLLEGHVPTLPRGGKGGSIRLNQAALVASGVSITGASAAYGGAVRAEASTLYFEDSEISGNTASKRGGAFVLFDSELALHDTVVSDNSSGEYGGAIYLEQSGKVVCTSTSGGGIWGNTASSGGGAIYANMAGFPSVVSTGCDWDGSEDNSPSDIQMGTVSTDADLGDDETFECDSSGC